MCMILNCVPDKRKLLDFFPDIQTAFDLMLNSKLFLNQGLIKLFKACPNFIMWSSDLHYII